MTNILYNFKNLSYVIKDVYFSFMNNNEYYNDIPNSYKIIKYLIHGVYKKMIEDNKTEEKVFITPTIIYNYLLTCNIHLVKELLFDYSQMIKLLYKTGGNNNTTYNYIQYPEYIMNTKIKSNNKKKIKNKIPSQFKKPNSKNNYLRNKNHNNNLKNNNNLKSLRQVRKNNIKKKSN